MKYVSPSVKETAFNCPHCGALAKQFWSVLCLDPLQADMPVPRILSQEDKAALNFEEIQDPVERDSLLAWIDKMIAGMPFVEDGEKNVYLRRRLRNCAISECFNCGKVSIWVRDKLMYPVVSNVLPANVDMPDDVKRDYEEAGTILNLSPRGAAALLRLAIQKLCKELGQPGENINADIKALVAAGLDRRVQQALDAVRVIGNSAVHPGKIDIRDDVATAESLFKLLNLIVEKTISEDKHVQEVYDSLPDNLREAITKRDATNS